MPTVRISNARVSREQMAQAEQLSAQAEAALREPLSQLRGLLHFYAGIDRERGYLTNVSVWETPEDAHQLDTFQPMLAQRPILEAAGVSFEPITNNDLLWTITP
jgi:FPC/CPF motif-containing protein YcgG